MRLKVSYAAPPPSGRKIGEATRDPYLYISHNGTTLIDSPIDQLKPLWKDGLVKYY